MPEVKKSHKVRYAIIIVLIVIVVAGYFAYRMYFPKSSTGGSSWVPVEVNSQTLPNVLESTSVVHDLPEEGVISLKIGSSSYKVEKDSVVPGEVANPDVQITLPDKYFDIIGKSGLCNALKQATNSNELEVSFDGSSTSLAWKYRALAKYKSCIS